MYIDKSLLQNGRPLAAVHTNIYNARRNKYPPDKILTRTNTISSIAQSIELWGCDIDIEIARKIIEKLLLSKKMTYRWPLVPSQEMLRPWRQQNVPMMDLQASLGIGFGFLLQ